MQISEEVLKPLINSLSIDIIRNLPVCVSFSFVIERSTGFAPNRNTSQAVFIYRDGSFTVD